MSKGAVLTMTRSIAIDYVKQGIRCNCICPARDPHAVRRRLPRRELPRPGSGDADNAVRVPADRPHGPPDEVAALALYLCSDEAAFVTGAAYPIDGGVIAI